MPARPGVAQVGAIGIERPGLFHRAGERRSSTIPWECPGRLMFRARQIASRAIRRHLSVGEDELLRSVAGEASSPFRYELQAPKAERLSEPIAHEKARCAPPTK